MQKNERSSMVACKRMLKRGGLLLLILVLLFLTRPGVSLGQAGATLSAPLNPSSTNTWEKFTYPLTAETFGVDDESFRAVLAQVTEFRIVTEFSSARDAGAVDSISIGNRFRADFDSGIEGWAVRNDGTLEWVPSGGVSGGYIQISDWGTGQYHWAIAPAEWSGDWRDLIGSSIVFYLKTTHPDSEGPKSIEITSGASKRLILSADPLIVPIGGTSTARVTVNPPAEESLEISLSSAARNCMTVPDSVTIGSGQASADFRVSAVLGAEFNCAAVIEASASGFDTARITLRVGEEPAGGVSDNLRCGLGRSWSVIDTNGEWIGVWTRRGDSNVFDGRWEQPGYEDVIATLTIQVSGNQVVVERQDIGDPNNFGVTGCTYEGTVAADGVSVSGSATCVTRSGMRIPVSWSATINCEPSSGSASTSGPEGPGGAGTPWETPAGQNCFEQWIREAMSRLNAYDGDDDFNARKPWSINQYGILEGNPRIGPTSVAAPDNFAEYNYNKYWWMWDQYPAESVSDWRLPEWRAAQVPPLRAYVRNCADQAGGAGGDIPPGSTGTSSVPGDDVAPPDFGSPEPAPVSRMMLQAGQRQVVGGQLVNVPVWLINGADVANINFTVGYDAGVATPEGDPIKGNLLDNALFSANTGDTGLIRAGFAQTSGIDGTGTVAYIPFRAVGKPGDRTVLDVAVSTINNPGGTVLTIDRIDGAILIVGPDGVVPGDCDGDGTLTEVDALCALQMSVQLIPERLVLDLDTDSQVTSRDSVIILQGAIGK